MYGNFILLWCPALFLHLILKLSKGSILGSPPRVCIPLFVGNISAEPLNPHPHMAFTSNFQDGIYKIKVTIKAVCLSYFLCLMQQCSEGFVAVKKQCFVF